MIYTTIYWLVDTRPEVLRVWPDGLPFYCGMTTASMKSLECRFRKIDKHQHSMADLIRDCGAHLVVRPMEIVPPLCGEREKLKHWQERLVQTQYSVLTKQKPHSTKYEAWLERQRNIAARTAPKKLPPPPY